MKKLQWTSKLVKPLDLTEMPGNPRMITAKAEADLEQSLAKFGLAELPIVDADNTIIAGHRRIKLLIKQKKGNDPVEVRVPNRKLTDKERKRYNILSNVDYGIWDEQKLAKFFNQKKLVNWGFMLTELPQIKINQDVNPIKDGLATYLDGKKKQVVAYFMYDDYNTVIDRLFKLTQKEKLQNAPQALIFLADYYENNRGKKKGR